MGQILHVIDRLPPPLILADERITTIPKGDRLVVPNRDCKLLFFLNANLELTIPGRPKAIIRAGDILVVPLRVMQTYRVVGGREDHHHVLRILVRSSSAPLVDPIFPETLNDIHLLPRGLTPRHHELINQLRSEMDGHRPGYRLMAGGLCLELVAETLRHIHAAANAPTLGSDVERTATTDAHVRRAKEFILENYEKPLRMEDIAWSVRLSREHFSRLFHRATGSTVFDYLTRIRIEAAKSHLYDSNLLVTQVAALTGFTSDALFCRTFKRIAGFTPSDYRQRILQDSDFEATLRYRPDKVPDIVPETLRDGTEGFQAVNLARRVESRPDGDRPPDLGL